jgi:hypothetical protein
MTLAATTFDPAAALLWGGAAAVVLFAMGGGFLAGVLCAPWLQEWAVRRAAARIQKLYEVVMADAERTQRWCAELAAASGNLLSVEQCERVERMQRGFEDTLTKIVQSCRLEQTQVL